MPSCVRLVICFLNGCRCSHDDHIPANYSTLPSVWETLALCICQMENITNHTGGWTVSAWVSNKVVQIQSPGALGTPLGGSNNWRVETLYFPPFGALSIQISYTSACGGQGPNSLTGLFYSTAQICMTEWKDFFQLFIKKVLREGHALTNLPFWQHGPGVSPNESPHATGPWTWLTSNPNP